MGANPSSSGERTHTLFSFFSRVGDPGRFLFCPLSISHAVREDAIKYFFTLIFLPFSGNAVSLNPKPRLHPQETGAFLIQFPTARDRRTLPKGGAERPGRCVLIFEEETAVERLTF